MDLGLKDKVALITGGSEGIGRAAALSIAREGGSVVIVARRADVLQSAAEAISRDTGSAVLPVACDVTAPDAAERIVTATKDRFGRLDILVNNAGTSMAKPFDQVTDSEWSGDFDLKLWSAIRLIRGALPLMRQQGGGRIINVTNLAGRAPGASSLPTSISRAAGIAVTKALSKDLAAENVLVNTVCIGFIKSGQHERRYRKAQADTTDFDPLYAEEAKRRGIPLGRAGEAREAGDVIAFLASAPASYVTGVAINIDGGTAPVV